MFTNSMFITIYNLTTVFLTFAYFARDHRFRQRTHEIMKNSEIASDENRDNFANNETFDEDTEEKDRVKTSNFSHEELVELTREAVNKIIESDPFFADLPPDVTTEEIKAQSAVAQGQAITLYLNRGELPKLAIVVPPHNTTVLALKKAIQRQTNLSLRRENIRNKISWKHVWKKYHLCFQDVRLCDDRENIKSYGIVNKAELHYVKRRREKNKFVNK